MVRKIVTTFFVVVSILLCRDSLAMPAGMTVLRNREYKFSILVPDTFKQTAPRGPNVKLVATDPRGATMNVIVRRIEGMDEIREEDWKELIPSLKEGWSQYDSKIIEEKITNLMSHKVYYVSGVIKLFRGDKCISSVCMILYLGTHEKFYQIAYMIPVATLGLYTRKQIEKSIFSFADETDWY